MDRISGRLLIVADDLTGALDTAAPFAARGRNVLVVTDPAALPDAVATGADVVAISTRSREIDATEAAERVAEASRAIVPGMRLLKKVDSRLKGNIVAELGALDFHRALVVPAIPGFGRIVRDAMIEGFGVDEPISVRDRLGPFAQRSYIPDTVTVEQMEAAVDACGPDDLLVGARALAEALARHSARQAVAATLPPAQHVLMAIGSRDPITVAQIGALRAAMPNTRWIAAPNGVPENHTLSSGPGLTVIQATPGSAAASGEDVAASLATACSAFSPRPDVMLLSGGATAEAFFGRERIGVLRLIGEILPGLPVAEHEGRFYITKSGGFGEPDALLRVASAALLNGNAP